MPITRFVSCKSHKSSLPSPINMNNARWPLTFGALLSAAAIILAAISTHALPDIMLDPVRAHRFTTALHMQQTQGLGLLLMGVALLVRPNHRLWQIAAVLLGLGILSFCGNLYLLALLQTSPATWLTPLGGLCMIGAWLVFALGACKRQAL